jgi:Methyltransferase domain
LIKSWLRGLPPAWQNRLRRFGRLRWFEKARIVRGYGVSFRERPLLVTRYVLLDPEVGDFSYALDNEHELVDFLARALGLERTTIAGYLAEIATDEKLRRELAERVRWRVDMKRRIGFGPRVGWYAITRAVKPRLIVETGIKHGLGSLVLLSALERNAREGSPGQLISFDTDPFSGWVVPEHLRERWQPVLASTFDALDVTLEGREVDLFICDTPPNYEIESFEMRTAMRHASKDIALIAANGDRTTALPELAAEMNGEYCHFVERPRRHIYPGAGLGLARDMKPRDGS